MTISHSEPTYPREFDSFEGSMLIFELPLSFLANLSVIGVHWDHFGEGTQLFLSGYWELWSTRPEFGLNRPRLLRVRSSLFSVFSSSPSTI